MSLFPNTGGATVSAPAATITYAATAHTGSGATSYTYSSFSLSTADATRKVVVACNSGFGTRTVSSITVGGVSATYVRRQAGAAYSVELWEAAVPTGTTGDIVVVWSGAQNFCSIGVWAVYNAASTVTATAVSTANPLSASVTVSDGGVSIGAANASDAATATWTELTENYDTRADPVTFAARMTGANKEYAAGGSPTVTCTWTTSTNPAMVLATWDKG